MTVELRSGTGALDFSLVTDEIISSMDEPCQLALLALMKANEAKEAAVARRNAATRRVNDAIADEEVKRVTHKSAPLADGSSISAREVEAVPMTLKNDTELLIQILDDYSSGVTNSLETLASRNSISVRTLFMWMRDKDLVLDYMGRVGVTFGQAMTMARSVMKHITVIPCRPPLLEVFRRERDLSGLFLIPLHRRSRDAIKRQRHVTRGPMV